MIWQGMLLGKYVNNYYLKTDEFRTMFVLSCGLSHTTNIFLSIMYSLGTVFDEIDNKMGISYPMNGEDR